MQSPSDEITPPLPEIKPSNPKSMSELISDAYEELHDLAERIFSHEWRLGHTLQPTALVHETVLRLWEEDPTKWKSRKHFFNCAAQIMRHFLVDYARERNAKKGPGKHEHVELTEGVMETSDFSFDDPQNVLALDAALQKLRAILPRQAQIAELRIFVGLTVKEVADTLGVGRTTVNSEWHMARAWLRRELE